MSILHLLWTGNGSRETSSTRQKTTKMAWTNSFRIDMYQKHHNSEHPSEWERYQACSYEEKAKYFGSKIPFQNTTLAHVNSNGTPLQIDINASIVDTLISDMFFHSDDQGGITQKMALKLFVRKEEYYQVTISNPEQFRLAVAYIACGLSFRQCEGILADTRRITGRSAWNFSYFQVFHESVPLRMQRWQVTQELFWRVTCKSYQQSSIQRTDPVGHFH